MLRRLGAALVIIALSVVYAFGQTPGLEYPCATTASPQPVLCYSVELLNPSYTGSALTVQHQTSTGQQSIGFSGDHLDTASLTTFQGIDTYVRVVGWNNQISAGSFDASQSTPINTTGNTSASTNPTIITNLGSTTGITVGMAVIGAAWTEGTKVTAVDTIGNTVTVLDPATSTLTTTALVFQQADTPRIYQGSITLGGFPALSLQGGSHSGRVFGLDITSNLSALGITGQDYSIFMVLRPTSSIFRNQLFTPGLANGTYISLEKTAPFTSHANTGVGNATISGITNVASVQVGMSITGTAFASGGIVQSVDVGTATAIINTVATATTSEDYTFSFPVAKVYANGQDNPGSFSATDGNSFNFFPTDTAIEIDPVVLAATSNSTGVKVYQNEVGRTTPFRGNVAGNSTRAYLGRWGGGIPGSFSQSGDFWVAAVLVYNVGLTELQRARVSAQLYQRFSIAYQRSNSNKKRLVGYGDSIPASYNASALYGMFSRLADQFPNVNFLNYSVPGSTVTSIIGTPAYGYNVGMFPISVADASNYSRLGNYIVLVAGGNDMVNTFAQTNVTISGPATPAVIHYPAHGAQVNQRIRFATTIQLPSPFVGGDTIYYVKTVIGPDDFTVSTTPGGAAVNTTNAGFGQQSAFLYTKMAADIMAGIQSVVDQFIAVSPSYAPRAAFVGTILPRQGNEYNFILNDVNTLIRAGGSGNYALIDFYTNSCLATIPGPCYNDFGGHPSDFGHQQAANVMQPILATPLQ